MNIFQQKDDHLLVDSRKGAQRLEVLEGPTGRRSWPRDVKARIVAESFLPGARVCDVARRNGLAPQHLSTWRRQAREGRLVLNVDDTPDFAALVVEDERPACAAALSAKVEIEASGVIIRLPSDSPAGRIAEIAVALAGTSS